MFRNKLSFSILLLAVLVLSAFNVKAQSQKVSGMVTGNNERLSGAVVKNLTTHDEGNSDDRGMFSIRVSNGDTLLTSSVFYNTDTLVYHQQSYLIIQLKQPIRVLQEVVVKDTLLDPLERYNQNKKDYKDIFWKGDKSHMVTIPLVLGPQMGIAVNIDKLYSALSKQGKDARRLQRTLAQGYRNSVVDQHFNKGLVSRITGYKGKKLDDFIEKYRPSYEFVAKATTYEMIEYTKQKLALELKGKG
jgi:hypothetical protein